MFLNMALAYSEPDFFETVKTSLMNQIFWLDLLAVAGWSSALKMLLYMLFTAPFQVRL